MKKRALIVVVAAVFGLLMTAVAPPGGATAQPQPTLTLTPASGPCDATVEVEGTGFEPGSEIPLDLAGPHSDVSIARLAVATTGPEGEFSVQVTFGPLGCEAAARDTEVGDPGGPRDLGIFAGHDPARRFVLARAVYHYTTTTPSVPGVLPSAGDGGAMERHLRVPAVNASLAGAGAQPQPTLVLSPASGPCDAPLQAEGNGYPTDADIRVSLGRPHSEGDFAVLASAMASTTGGFRVAVDLGSPGCEVAALDDRLDSPGEPKELFIFAYVPPAPFPGGSAYATYTYTTTMARTSQPPAALPRAGTGACARDPGLGWTRFAAVLAGAALLVGLGTALGLLGVRAARQVKAD